MKAAWQTAWVVGLLVGMAAHGQKAELVVQTGHSSGLHGGVQTLAFSPDGRILASGGGDHTILLWEVKTGIELRSMKGYRPGLDALAFSPDGGTLASGGAGNRIQLWDVRSGHELPSLTGDDRSGDAGPLAFSPDGRTLGWISRGLSRVTVTLWDLAAGRELRTIAGAGPDAWSGGPIAFGNEGRTLAWASKDGTLQVWDVATGQEIHTVPGPTDGWDRVAISADGRIAAWPHSSGGTIELRDIATGQHLPTVSGYTSKLGAVVLSADGRTLVSPNSLDSTINVWDAASGRHLRTFAGPAPKAGGVDHVAVSPDGRTVASSNMVYGTIQLWNVGSGGAPRNLAGMVGPVATVAFSPDGRTLASGREDGTITLWDVGSGRGPRNLPHEAGGIACVGFSPDGRTLASGGAYDGTLKLWDVASGQELHNLPGHTAGIEFVKFSHDGRLLASGSADNTVRVWDVATGRELHTLHQSVDAVVFAADDQSLILGTMDLDAVYQWDLASGHLLGPPSARVESFGGSIAFSPDGRTLASARENRIVLRDATSWGELRTLDGQRSGITPMVFSPDGRTLAAGTRNGDGAITLWDVASGQELRNLTGHTDDVDAISFSSDGRFLLSGSADGSARVWDVASGSQLASLVSFSDGGWAVVDPEGRFDTSDLDGGAPLHWTLSDDPMHALPLEIFMRDYYTPRLLARVMNGETLPPVRSIAEIKNRVQPDVAVVSISASKTRPGRADVVVHAASHVDEKGQASGLQDLRLFRNGQLVGYREGSLKDGDFRFSDIQLPTTAKSVTFTAYAFNSERIKSATAEKEYAYVPGPAAKARAWLLQIGVNHYEASGCELHGSANDAGELSKILAERLTARGLEVRPTVLVSTDQANDATKAKIREALARIAAQATPDDVFFLSFSGHGYSNQKGQFYILPADVQGSCAGVTPGMLQSAISADDLTRWLRPIDAGQMTFILDSCDSASSVESNDFKPGPMGSPGLGQLAYDKRMRILAASQPNQAARESATLHQGLLSYALTELGLVEGEADWKPKDGKITVGEWLGFAADEVPKFVQTGAVKSARGMSLVGAPEKQVPSAQTPALFDFSKQDSFVLQ